MATQQPKKQGKKSDPNKYIKPAPKGSSYGPKNEKMLGQKIKTK